MDRKTHRIDEDLDKTTRQYLQRLAREEDKLNKQLQKKDSAAARRIFAGSQAGYQQLQQSLQQRTGQLDKLRNVYSGHLDSMKTALSFLQQPNQELSAKVKDAVAGVDQLQGRLNQAEEVKKFLAQRQAYLQQQLQKFGMTAQLDQFKRTAYYYKAQVAEYKKTFEDPAKIEAKTMEALSNLPAFRDFFAKNSQLGSLFRLPGSGTPTAGGAAIPGLPTADDLNKELTQRFGSVPDLQQVAQQATGGGDASQLTQLKDKFSQTTDLGGTGGLTGGLGGSGTGSSGGISGDGAGGSDKDMPNFKPNGQKTKKFGQRLEYGINAQTTQSNSFFPATTAFGLSVGYKLNDKSVVGIGASYRMGWGRDIHHIAISEQGAGFRSYLDWKLKGSFWVSGGAELNYQPLVSTLSALSSYNAWQKSALLGLSKKYKAGRKLNGNVQLLYDFLYRQHVPATQPWVFRVGYSF
ncbi:hypothetical protein GCM10011511_49500 [Puia dinghuensis]|uniref:Uncharacterized protein n=1 Tax=Puia dinghuensis TaxID=1792502 RepID=A0A8J2UI12_9BACT|nr:hypothetical protein GCM10011511_49500 [Puia dinghuensis]